MKDTADTTLIVKRTFNAPVAKVYAAWANPDQFCQWMGPAADMVCQVNTYDVAVDGAYSFEITSADGSKHAASGIFREVAENSKLVFTWTWAHVPDRETLVTVELRAEGDVTHMTFTHELLGTKDTRDHHKVGWTGSFEKLERFIAGQSSAASD